MRRTFLVVAFAATALAYAAPAQAGLGDLIARNGGRQARQEARQADRGGAIRTVAFRRGGGATSASASSGGSVAAPATGLTLGGAVNSTRGQCSTGGCDR